MASGVEEIPIEKLTNDLGKLEISSEIAHCHPINTGAPSLATTFAIASLKFMGPQMRSINLSLLVGLIGREFALLGTVPA